MNNQENQAVEIDVFYVDPMETQVFDRFGRLVLPLQHLGYSAF